MDKITGISDGTHLIPVSWKLNAGVADKDVSIHNAIIMGTIMARKIDTMRLWDGTLMLTQNVGTISVSGYTDSKIVDISEKFSISLCENNYSIIETFNPLAIVGYDSINLASINAVLPSINNVKVYNNEYTEIVVEFDNPVYCEDETILGFSFTAIVGQISNNMTPTDVVQTGTNTFAFTFDDFSTANTIVVIYDNETGNIKDNAYGNLINYFVKTIAIEIAYSEGE